MGRPAIFLDRDGVVIENRADYVRSWADVQIFPQAIEALVAAGASAHAIVLVTNQSAIGRGLISYETARAINERLLAHIRRAGGRVDAVYMCPHAPDERCACRKPRPGMLLRAADDLDLDLRQSVMIGDALTDIQAGRAAMAGRSILVRTGRGRDEEMRMLASGPIDFLVFDTLADALAFHFEARS